MPKANVLTEADWKAIVAENIIPAYHEQINAKVDEHIDWVGRRLIRDGWTTPCVRWCAERVAAKFRKLDNLLAMMTTARDGFAADGSDGWWHCPEYRAIEKEASDRRSAAECRDHEFDHRKHYCGKLGYCAYCAHNPKV